MTVMLDELKDRLRVRVLKCFMCHWILLDLEANDGKLKGWNMDLFGKPVFARQGEIAHLKLEGFSFMESEL